MRIAVALALVGLLLRGFAATPNYVVDEAPPGLPQRSVISMVQTRDGYLWLGTVKGLVRFDGARYETFNTENTPGLQGNTIVYLLEDSQGGLWIGADQSVALLRNGELATLEIPTVPGGSAEGGRLQAACEDVTGAVWLYLRDGRLVRCRDGKVENVWWDGIRADNRFIVSDKNGQIWIGAGTFLFRLASDVRDEDFQLLLQNHMLPGPLDYLLASRSGGFWMFVNGRIHKVPPEGFTNAVEVATQYPWQRAPIKAVIEDRRGNLVVGTLNERVFVLTPEVESHAITNISQETALSLCEDREGNLWVGTDGGGLNQVRVNPFELVPPTVKKVVQSVAKDASGGLWFGYNGGGVTYWKDGVSKDYGVTEGLIGLQENNNPNFSAVLVDRQQKVWVGTRDLGLFEFVGGRFSPVREPRLRQAYRSVSALFEDRNGNLWVGTDAGLAKWDGTLWRWFTVQSGLTANHITAIAEDASGALWIGTKRNGLNRWHEEKFTAFHRADGLPGESITALYVDKENVLWVGTGNGLARYQSGKWTRFGVRDGLVSGDISYILDDEREHLWVGSNLGLMRLTKASLNAQALGKSFGIVCRVYNEEDGLPTSECTQGSQPAACRTDDGRLWLPTIRGLVGVNPADLMPNTNPPPVVIESVLFDDQEQKTNRLSSGVLQKLVVPASVERLEVFCSSLNLTAPGRARFRYWLEGHEVGWSAPTERRNASYSKLPPDNYRLHVQASNEDGVWNTSGAILEILVLPPFWKTWWFRTLVVVALLGSVAGIVYLISTQKLQRQLALLRQQEALERERARIARDLHDQLGANLTQVGLLGEMVIEDKNLPAEIESHAQQICQTARTTSDALDEIVWAANPSNDTLEGLVNYACKYAQDYLSLADLRYRLDVPPTLPAINIPPELRHNVFLAFKESVNNVVKHAQASEVKIRLRLNDGDFRIEIEDDGRGPAGAATKTGRNGLRNMRKRMEDVGGSFEMQPGAERGTLVRLIAPIAKN